MKLGPPVFGYFLLYVYAIKLTKKSQSNLRAQHFRLFTWLKQDNSYRHEEYNLHIISIKALHIFRALGIY